MNEQPDTDRLEGKRLFEGLTNISTKKNYWPVLDSEKGGKELFHRKIYDDFPDKSA